MRISARVAVLAFALLAMPRLAAAQGSEGTGIGVGVESMLTGSVYVPGGNFLLGTLAGPAVVYQTPLFHADAIAVYESNGQTTIALAARFFYEIASTQSSDLSLGGGLGFVNTDPGEGLDSQTDFLIQLGGQVRGFLTPNVSINASLGLGIVLGDVDIFTLTGQLLGGAGITYYFF